MASYSPYYNYNSDYNEPVDSYQQIHSFDLFNSLFELLNSAPLYDQATTYDVCVLTFTQGNRPLHWSIYLQSQDFEGGPVLDVWWHGDNQGRGFWQREEQAAHKVTHRSSVWRRDDGVRASGKYNGGTVLGSIDNIDEFLRIARGMEMPRSEYSENCQTWVRNVVSAAVRMGLLEEEALGRIQGVPRGNRY